MTEYTINPNYLCRDGEPWFPIMGEFHYSRYPRRYWAESLGKLRAGGVTVVSTYVFWIHHEEIRGDYDFTGDRDLRAFVEAAGQAGLALFLRIGPWSHGECRNGGFPDWLLAEPYPLRENDERYFAQVKRFYAQIYAQVAGLLLKDGGPIIGVQIENEYGHVGGQTGEAGEAHMRRLAALAREVGFDVPLYTATGWGGAVTGGLLPVMGGYCEAPWDQSGGELPPSGNYVFTEERNDHNIGSDHGLGEGITFDVTKFPYLTAELGGGLQVTHHRRPVATAADIGAMSLAKLGSGVSLLGYYMYHGGTNPVGKQTTLQESRESGYPNDVPVLSYDFNAPIREYGQMSDTLRELKLLTLFLADFGSELCTLPARIPVETPRTPRELTGLRIAYRCDDTHGYVFVNNYQRRYQMAAHPHTVLIAETEDETIQFPPVDIADGDYFFYPYQMRLSEQAVLRSATAVPLLRLSGETDCYVFYTDGEPNYALSGNLGRIRLLTLTRAEALHAWRLPPLAAAEQQTRLLISGCDMLRLPEPDGDFRTYLVGRALPEFAVYPRLERTPAGFAFVTGAAACGRFFDDGRGSKTEESFAKYVYTGTQPEAPKHWSLTVREETDGSVDRKTGRVYSLLLQGDFMTAQRGAVGEVFVSDCFLRLSFVGDGARLYVDGRLAADCFYTGQVWEIGLKRFDGSCEFRLELDPLFADAAVFLETKPPFENGVACALLKAELVPEYRVALGNEISE